MVGLWTKSHIPRQLNTNLTFLLQIFSLICALSFPQAQYKHTSIQYQENEIYFYLALFMFLKAKAVDCWNPSLNFLLVIFPPKVQVLSSRFRKCLCFLEFLSEFDSYLFFHIVYFLWGIIYGQNR